MVPLASELPPVAAVYQFNVPALAMALKSTVPAPQRLAGVVLVIVGVGVMLATMAVRGEVHPLLVAST